jgi:hypothetical protein
VTSVGPSTHTGPVTDSPTKTEALARLREGHDRVARAVARLSADAMSRPGLGGKTWSPKDLLGHLTSWEAYALAALGAWREGSPAPIDVALRTKGLNEVNAEAVAAKRTLAVIEIREEFVAVHRELVRALESISDDAWTSPGTRRMRRPLGAKVGAILGGPGGWFRHADAHLPDIEAFAAEHGTP